MKLKPNLENEGVELNPKVGAGWIGRSVRKKGKREGVKGRVKYVFFYLNLSEFYN